MRNNNTDQLVLLATYMLESNHYCKIMSTFSQQKREWGALLMPNSPAALRIGETAISHGVGHIAIYLDNNKFLTPLRNEVRTLCHLIGDKVRIHVGGAIDDAIETFPHVSNAIPTDTFDEFLLGLDNHLASTP